MLHLIQPWNFSAPTIPWLAITSSPCYREMDNCWGPLILEIMFVSLLFKSFLTGKRMYWSWDMHAASDLNYFAVRKKSEPCKQLWSSAEVSTWRFSPAWGAVFAGTQRAAFSPTGWPCLPWSTAAFQELPRSLVNDSKWHLCTRPSSLCFLQS